MSELTSIGSQKTPGRPIEITFSPETGLPNEDQELLLLGHAASGATGINTVISITNAGDSVAAKTEAETKFGVGSELSKMVIAAVLANEAIGGSNFPAIKCVPLDSADAGFGTSDAALTAVKRVKAEFVVSPYDGANATLRDKLKDAMATMSAAQRVENDQYGSVGVVFNRAQTDPSLLAKPDTQYILAVWQRDTGTGGDAPAYSLGEMAAACAARIAALIVPFNPLDKATIGGIDAPAKLADYVTVGADAESESALNQGWTPLMVKPNGEVAFVRTITSRLTQNADGVTDVTAYYDVQDFMVLYFWRKTVKTRFSQVDFTERKAGAADAREVKAELIRLATAFEDNNMFQAVAQLAKQFIVQRNASDRHRFDSRTPVNVIPGLHTIANNTQAGTQFDEITI